MRVNTFGNSNNPSIFLLPGTMCYWKGNFGNVIESLSKDYYVCSVSYTGFDERDNENFDTILNEVKRIEDYIQLNLNGCVDMVYGSSLGGSLVAHLVNRKNIHIRYALIGSSDFDQMKEWQANILTKLVVKITYNFIHTGSYQSKLMKKRFHKQMKDPYNRAFVATTGRDKYDLRFISKESIQNQFYFDLTTPLPQNIDTPDTMVHIFYAKKMGEKYLKRYQQVFHDPIVHTFDLRHEELLGLYPDMWCDEIQKIMGKEESK